MAKQQQLIVENFKYGVDRRRSYLTSVPGTLYSLVNAHITQGASIEKRKAFVRLENEDAGTTTLPAGTFGFQHIANGILVFGSIADPIGSTHEVVGYKTTDGQHITYQRLRHPSDPSGVGTGSLYGMYAVVHSELFNGKAWVIASFGTGGTNGTFAFYNGSPVYDFVYGLVLSSLTTKAEIAQKIAEWVNATETYTAVWTASNAYVDVYGVPGDSYQLDVAENSVAGTLVAAFVANGTDPTPAASATCQFEVAAGTAAAANKMTSVKIGSQELLNPPSGPTAILWTSSNEATAELIAVSIRLGSATSGFTAKAVGAVVTIAAVATGTTANGAVLTTIGAGDFCVDKLAFQLVQNTGTSTVPSITHIIVNGVDILTGTAAGASISAVISAAVLDINTNNATYLSSASGNQMSISRRTSTSTSPNLNVTINVNSFGGIVSANTPIVIALSVTEFHLPSGGGYTVTITPSGGLTPYLYYWEELPGGTGSVVNVGIDNINQGRFSLILPVITGKRTFVAHVKDANNEIATSPVLTVTTG